MGGKFICGFDIVLRLFLSLFSSPEPESHKVTYRMGGEPASVRPSVRQSVC